MEKGRLSFTQEKVLDFLVSTIRERGFPPTLREIAHHLGLKGPRSPQKTLSILERKGHIKRIPRESRAIEVLGVVSPGPTTVSVPVIGKVTAGEPILAIENIEGHVNLDKSLLNSEDVFLLRVQGDSMIEAHIQDGDFALVKPQASAEDGEIVVVLIEDEATMKRIFKKRNFIRLEPANPSMEPILVRKGDKRVTIVGKVIGIFRKIK